MSFSAAQKIYAEHNIVTFPVRITIDPGTGKPVKKPAIKGYGKIGLRRSAELASRPQFADADAFGFMTGTRSKITVLDVDTKDETILANALERHGTTPLIIRSGSGKFHAYYRHSGERRRIRPWEGLPIDLLGTGGYAVAPPSRSAVGQYEIIQGNLDDIQRLPKLRNLGLVTTLEGAKDGERGEKLFRHLMKAAALHVDDFETLLDVGHTFNDTCEPPMEASRVEATAKRAWDYTGRGANWFGRGGVVAFDNADIIRLVDDDPDLYLMLSYLRAHNGPNAKFIATIDWLCGKLRWRRRQVMDVRRRLTETYAEQVSRPSPGRAAYFRWRRI